MRTALRLGPANLALVSLYFAPVLAATRWRADVALSRTGERRAGGTLHFGRLFNFALDGLMATSSVLPASSS
jgi:hypothetical protein